MLPVFVIARLLRAGRREATIRRHDPCDQQERPRHECRPIHGPKPAKEAATNSLLKISATSLPLRVPGPLARGIRTNFHTTRPARAAMPLPPRPSTLASRR